MLHIQRAVILLPLCPASLVKRKLQRRRIIHGMCPVGRKDQSVDLNIFVEISHLCNLFGSYYGCCLTIHISFSICCAIK